MPRVAGLSRFSPLLVGSVVATFAGIVFRDDFQVSVPYWSGQWLQPSAADFPPHHRAFQSPIGRVSGCNLAHASLEGQSRVGFSPLLVGSVVATGFAHPCPKTRALFQSPIGRVSGCNCHDVHLDRG